MEPIWLPSTMHSPLRGEDQVSPRASELACRPTLTNSGWVSRRGAPGTAANDEEEEEDAEEDAPPKDGGGGGGACHRGRGVPPVSDLRKIPTRCSRLPAGRTLLP